MLSYKFCEYCFEHLFSKTSANDCFYLFGLTQSKAILNVLANYKNVVLEFFKLKLLKIAYVFKIHKITFMFDFLNKYISDELTLHK